MVKIVLLKQQDYEYASVRQRVGEIVERLGGISRFVKPGYRVLLKANLLSGHAPGKRITTDPAVVKAVAELVLDAGATPFIADSPGMDPFFHVAETTGMKALAAELGIEVRELLDPVPAKLPSDSQFKRIEISRQALEADAVINLPKLKTHCQMLLTLGVKNLFGTVVAQRKAEWHYRVGLDRDVFASLHLDIYRAVDPVLTIMDGIWGMEGHGPANGTPRNYGLLAGAVDAVALDTAICHMLGIPLRNFPLYRAAKRRGIGETDLERMNFEGDLDGNFVLSDVDVPRLRSMSLLPSFMDGIAGNLLTSRPFQLREKCIGCRKCVDICPAGAITIDEERNLTFDYEKCIRCYCCQEMCPQDAIAFRKSWLQRLLEIFKR